MNLFELYKEHINPEPTGVEIHEFFKSFSLHGAIVLNPLNEALNKTIINNEAEKRNLCERWIIENSNLKRK